MIDIALEQPTDLPAIESLLDAAFGPNRRSKISYSYRQGIERIEPLCMIAREGGQIVGTIRYWPIVIGRVPALLLGPIAIRADRRGDGLGGLLMRTSLARAAELGHRTVLLVGDEPYYGRFGFRHASEHGIVMPMENPARVLVLSLAAEASLPSGQVRPWRSVRRAA
ncbi:MAG TPA: N-acetyltransferase [Aliidongia sp.]|nr:N-acetyltransferase [Aliidongia sp.]